MRIQIPSCYKDTRQVRLGFSLKASFKLNYLFQGLFSKWSHSEVLGVRASTYEFGGITVQGSLAHKNSPDHVSRPSYSCLQDVLSPAQLPQPLGSDPPSALGLSGILLHDGEWLPSSLSDGLVMSLNNTLL